VNFVFRIEVPEDAIRISCETGEGKETLLKRLRATVEEWKHNPEA
jgi:hypothetical protein